MEILLGNTKLDCQLEDEKTVLDVIESIEEWLGQEKELAEKELVEKILVDGHSIWPSEKEKLEKTSIDSVYRLEVQTISQMEHTFRTILQLEDYLDRLIVSLKTKQVFELRKDLLEGLKWIEEVFRNVCQNLKIDASLVFYKEWALDYFLVKQNDLRKEFQNVQFHPEQLEAFLSKKLLEHLEELPNFIPKMIHLVSLQAYSSEQWQTETILSRIEDLKESIEAFSSLIPHIAIQLQSDEQSLAHRKIGDILGFIQTLLSHLNIFESLVPKKDSIELKSINLNLGNFLREFSDVFARQDWIFLGDLLEYELSNQFKEYQKILEKIIVFVEKKVILEKQ